MKKFTNPNFIYIAVFTIPVAVYSLGWSTIYPELTSDLLFFYIKTFVIALIAGVIIDQLPGYVFRPIPVSRYNGAVIVFLYLVYLLNFLYIGYIPLFAFTSGALGYGREDIGIPGVQLPLVTFTAFFAIYIFHQYLSHRTWKLLLLYLSTFVPFVLMLTRSSIMHVIISSVFMFVISQKRIAAKKVFTVFISGIAALYLFGFLGNIRSAGGDPTLIPKWSGATEEFLESSVPKEFYWSYLYISSPLANVQNNIKHEPRVHPDYKSFVILEMWPNFISKNLAKIIEVSPRWFTQINPWLNVGSMYVQPYSYLSWTGMYVIFIYIMFLMNLYYLIIRRSYLYGATGLSVMFTMIALATFQNSLLNSQFSVPLFFPFLFSIVAGLRKQIAKEKSKMALEI